MERIGAVALTLIAACQAGTRHPAAFFPECLNDRSCSAPVVQADSSLPPGSVRGLVLGKPESCRLGEAQVHTARSGRKVVANKDGSFSFSGLAPGPDTVVARFIGYAPEKVAVTIPRQGGLQLLITLDFEVVAGVKHCGAA